MVMSVGMRSALGRARNWWSAMKVKVQHFWSDGGPGSNCFWWQDVLLLLVGIQTELTSKWSAERIVRYFVNCLSTYHVTMILIQTIYALKHQREDVYAVVIGITKAAAFIVSTLKLLLIKFYQKPIENLRHYITNGNITSGDEYSDKLELRKFNEKFRVLIFCILGLTVIDIVFLSIPNPATEMVFRLPSHLQPTNPYISFAFRLFFISLLPLDFVPKFFCCMATIGTLLMGMRTNFKMLSHRYGSILNQPFVIDGTDWRRMNRELKETLAQHVEFWRHLKVLKNLVGRSFFLVHFFSVLSIGALCYVCHGIGVNFLAFVIIATMAMFMLEYYLFCHFVDSLQDVADRIGDHIFEICALMPYRKTNHSQYQGFKTDLMIAWINTRHGLSMNCVGLFDISKFAFLRILNIAYTVLTFLIQLSQLETGA
nr:uncharacterized protein LOC109621528 [Aedes albopictus]